MQNYGVAGQSNQPGGYPPYPQHTQVAPSYASQPYPPQQGYQQPAGYPPGVATGYPPGGPAQVGQPQMPDEEPAPQLPSGGMLYYLKKNHFFTCTVLNWYLIKERKLEKQCLFAKQLKHLV